MSCHKAARTFTVAADGLRTILRTPPLQAAVSIVAHVKVGGMLGRAAAPVMLARAARI